jgi:mannosyltransferase OCH1-like enzyme
LEISPCFFQAENETMAEPMHDPCSINRTVHWTWKDNAPPESLFPAWWRKTWQCAGWTFRLWTDACIREFLETQSPAMQQLFASYPKSIMRSDAFRYLLLKSQGGLYVDLDMVNLADDLSWLEACHQFACAEQQPGILCNAFLWAPHPEDPFFDGIEQALLAKAGETDPVSATGPRFLTSHAIGRDFLRLPQPCIYPISWEDAEAIREARGLSKKALSQKYPQSRAIHIWTSSWIDFPEV